MSSARSVSDEIEYVMILDIDQTTVTPAIKDHYSNTFKRNPPPYLAPRVIDHVKNGTKIPGSEEKKPITAVYFCTHRRINTLLPSVEMYLKSYQENIFSAFTSMIKDNLFRATGKKIEEISTPDDSHSSAPQELEKKCGSAFRNMLVHVEAGILHKLATETDPPSLKEKCTQVGHVGPHDPCDMKNKNAQLLQIMHHAAARSSKRKVFIFWDDIPDICVNACKMTSSELPFTVDALHVYRQDALNNEYYCVGSVYSPAISAARLAARAQTSTARILVPIRPTHIPVVTPLFANTAAAATTSALNYVDDPCLAYESERDASDDDSPSRSTGSEGDESDYDTPRPPAISIRITRV